MKVLYLGHYREGTGWSTSSINNILALNTLDIDLVTRNIRLTKELEVPEEILQLEKKDLQNIDVCIQHVLPHHLVATNKFKKNIAYFENETDTITYASNWLQSLQMMDEVWVPCEESKINLNRDGLKNVKVVPHTFDIKDYNHKNEIYFNNMPLDSFKFYYIGDLNDRKNIDNMLKCFHVAFSPSEPVELVLKVGSSHGPQHADQYINNRAEKIKRQLRLYNNIHAYKKEFIIHTPVSRKEILDIHAMCDCYLGISHGEAWNIPAFEAMAFGNTPICSDQGGPKQFIDMSNKATGSLVQGVQKIANHQDAAFPFLATGREMWFEPDDAQIIKTMRYYFENRKTKDNTSGLNQAKKFSYENIGKTMLECLNE